MCVPNPSFKQCRPTSQASKVVLGSAIFTVTSKNNPMWCREERLALGCPTAWRTHKPKWKSYKETLARGTNDKAYLCPTPDESRIGRAFLLCLCGKKNEVSDYLPFLAHRKEQKVAAMTIAKSHSPSSRQCLLLSLSISIAPALHFSTSLLLLHWGTANTVNRVPGPYRTATGTR